MTEYTFAVFVGELEIEVTYTVTDPGMAPRYGEDPDPGHDLELQIEGTTYYGDGISLDGLFVKLPWRYVPVEEYLLEQAYDYHARHGA
jgi:hypothetical protein